MVKFLLQHALALDDDDAEDASLDYPWSLSHGTIGKINSNIAIGPGLIERSQVAEGIITDMQMR
jgi:hypothetical protein